MIGNTQLLLLGGGGFCFSFRRLDDRWTLPECLSLLSRGSRLFSDSFMDFAICHPQVFTFSLLLLTPFFQFPHPSLQPLPLATLLRCQESLFPRFPASQLLSLLLRMLVLFFSPLNGWFVHPV